MRSESALARLLRRHKSKPKKGHFLLYCCPRGWQCFSRVVYPSGLQIFGRNLAHSYRSVRHPQKRSVSDITPSGKVRPYLDWWVIFPAACPLGPRVGVFIRLLDCPNHWHAVERGGQIGKALCNLVYIRTKHDVVMERHNNQSPRHTKAHKSSRFY